MKTENKVQKEKEVQSIQIEDYRDIHLQKDEVARIIISQKQDGSITTLTKGKGNPLGFIEAIGLLEVAKAEALLAARKKESEIDPALMQPVDIILDEVDVALDVDGMMEKSGLSIDGKTIQVSLFAAKQRELRREEYLSQKNKK